MQDPEKAISEYYKLKAKYEKKYNKFISSLSQDSTLTLKQKESKLAKFKKKCVSCNKDGGTIFSNEDNKLKAICGNVNNPCNLNIHIDKGAYQDLYEGINDFEEGLEENKKDIICTKLDLLFGYDSESIVLEKFKKMKEDFELDSIILQEQLTKLLNIENNSMKKVEIKNQNEKIYQLIDNLKENIKNYNETSNETYIKNSVLIYNKELKPLLDTNMKTKYQINSVVYNELDNTYKLIQNKAKFSDYLEQVEEPKVVSFKNGKEN